MVLRRANAATPIELRTKVLERYPRTSPRRPSSSLFYKYLRGSASPSEALVREIDGHVTGTAECFFHPLWSLVSAPRLTAEELGEILRVLPPRIRSRWVLDKYVPGDLFWRVTDMNFRRKGARINARVDLDSAAGAMAMVHDALIRQDQMRHMSAWRTWAQLGRRFRLNSQYGILYPHFFVKAVASVDSVRYEHEYPLEVQRKARFAAERLSVKSLFASERHLALLALQLVQWEGALEWRSPIGSINPDEFAFFLAIAGVKEVLASLDGGMLSRLGSR